MQETTVVSEELKYMGQALSAEPINLPLSAVAAALRGGDSVLAILEPGDATRYQLCLVPCWAPGLRSDLGAIGVPPQRAREYLLVAKFLGHGGDVFFASSDVRAFDLDAVQNEWSRELLSWWLRRLWKELDDEGPGR